MLGCHDPKYYNISDWLGPGRTKTNIMPCRGPLWFGNAIQGVPLCSEPMIQNIILPQIGLAQEKNKNNIIQGAHLCFWKRHTGGPLCLDSMIKNMILPQIGFDQDKIKQKRHTGSALCFGNAIQGPIVFGSRDPK